MTEEETKKHYWLRIASISLLVFISAFLAFYIVMEIMLNRITSPAYNVKRIEKMIKHQQRDFRKFEDKMMDSPFIPKMRPMLVNLVKEPSEYKVVVDLKPLDNSEKGVNVSIENNILTVSGEMDKKTSGSEKIIKFSQAYYLDEDLEEDKIIKEKKGDKYIITIPFED